MDIGDIKYLQAPAKVLKLSDAIREHGYVDSCDPYACVLGNAYTQTMGHQSCQRFKHGLPDRTYIEATSELFNVPEAMCRAAEGMCLHGKPKDEIADFLASKGY